MFHNSYQEILYRIDNWIKEGSGWVIKSVDREYFNISIFSPLSGSSYIELPRRLRNSMKGLINMKSSGNKLFFCCYVRHLNPLKTHPEKILKADKIMVNNLDYKSVHFPVSKKDFGKIKMKINSCINVFCLKITWFILFIYQMNKLKIV